MTDEFLIRLRRALAPDFSVDRLLGQGGMGIVLLAREVSLGKRVAIKTIRPELATAAAIERFRREAQTLAQHNHPCIVPVFQLLTRDGLPFMVMEYLEGETLHDRIARGRLPAEDVVSIGMDVLSALVEMHRRGVVHRDIKPSNVLFWSDRAVVTDFGIAKSDKDVRDPITKPYEIPGTEAYMAPEVRGGAEATPASDLYGVGMLLYEALTGCHVHQRVPVELPEAGDWRGVPRRLRVVIQRALAVDTSARWRDAASFREALRPPRPPILRIAALAIAAVITAVLVMIFWPRRALPDIALVSFRGATAADSACAISLTDIVGQLLGRYENRLSIAPVDQTIATVRRGGSVRADHLVSGDVQCTGSAWRLTLRVQRGSNPPATRTVFGSASNPWDFGARVAVDIVDIVRPGTVREETCRPANLDALYAWLDGKEAFRGDDWGTAELQFQKAVSIDPEFCVAESDLWLVQEWRRVRITVDLPRLLERHGRRLPETERLLLEAKLAPSRAQRHALYDSAARKDLLEAKALLQYGSELMHRGPLDGIGLDSSVTVLRAALKRDPLLAPAHDQLVWALIRLGRPDDARKALDALWRAAPDPRKREIHPLVFEVAYAARFAPESVDSMLAAAQAGPDGGAGLVSGLARVVRLALSFDVAPIQEWLGARITSGHESPAPERAHGHVAQGLALLALGRPNAGLAHLDTSAVLVPELALQAAQWKVLGPALGIPGIPEDTIAVARRRLATLAGGSPQSRRRASWTLAFDAMRRRDAAAVVVELSRLQVDTAARALWTIVLGSSIAQSNAAGALEGTQALRGVAEEQNKLGDQFARAVLHLERAKWYRLLGDSASAERELRWHESSDFEGWLQGPIQAAEVDWVAGMYVRYREGLRRVQGGEKSACADLKRVLELWRDAEPAVAAMAADGHHAVAAHCP